MPPRKTYKKSEASKRAILRAARLLAQQHGYENTSIRDIAQESGLSVGAFYHHFKSKDEVLRQSFLQFDDLLGDEAVARYDAMPPLEAMQSVLFDQTAFTEGIGPALMRQYYRAQLQGDGYEAVNPQRGYYRAVCRYAQKAQAEGTLRASPSADTIAQYLIQSVRGALVDWCLHDGSYSAVQHVRRQMPYYLMPFLV